MTTTIEIPDSEVKELMERTRAETEREAILAAIRFYNKRERLAELNKQIHGSMPDFMTQEELQQTRSIAKDQNGTSAKKIEVGEWIKELEILQSKYTTGKPGSSSETILEEDRADRL